MFGLEALDFADIKIVFTISFHVLFSAITIDRSTIVFWSLPIMVGLAMLMIPTGLWSAGWAGAVRTRQSYTHSCELTTHLVTASLALKRVDRPRKETPR